MKRTAVLLGLVAVLTAACGSDARPGPIEPPPDSIPTDSTPSADLAVLGLGAVTDRYTAEVASDGTWAYTSTWSFRAQAGNTVYVWNVTDDTPQLVDSLFIENASTTGDVQISDDGTLLVVATEYTGGSIVIYDRSDPAHPTLITRFQSPATTPGVHTVKLGRVEGRHYAFLSIDPGKDPARLVIVDITDPAQPVQVTSLTIGDPYVHDVFVRDGWLFTALWNDGMRIYDIGGAGAGGTVANPVALGTVETVGGQAHNMWWFHDPSTTTTAKRYVFVGQEGPGSIGASASGDIHVVDISDPANPREVAFYSVAGAGTHNFSMDEQSGILYAAYYNGGVRALDVRGDLSDCTTAQQSPDGRCDLTKMGRQLATALSTGENYVWGVQFVDGFVYASDMLNGVYKLDARELVR